MALDPAANNDMGVDVNDPQNALVLKQYSAAKRNLQQQQLQGQQGLEDSMNRQQAVTGLSGGAATKLHDKAIGQYNLGFSGQQAQLDTQQAADLQNVAATKQAQQYATSERLGSQQFQSSETAKQLDQNQQQFLSSLDLQNKQFQESKNEFTQQLNYQWNEFGENVKTNLINSAVAFQKAGLNTLPDNGYFEAVMSNIGKIRGSVTPPETVNGNFNPPGSFNLGGSPPNGTFNGVNGGSNPSGFSGYLL